MSEPSAPAGQPSAIGHLAAAEVEALTQRLTHALGDAYKIERVLGAGGFAVVYQVRDLTLKRALAVKVLSPEVITSHTVLERFRREAETIAQLSHPNIVPLHFIGQKDDLLYLAMACVDGGSLGERVKKGGLPVDEVRRVLTEVAGALAYAHKRGVVHRDIKPQNILVDGESGRCLVTDFGIARTTGSTLTSTGIVVGTLAYLAPEQVTGESIDHRADIYALGVMGYELLTGELPFAGMTPMAAMAQRMSGAAVSVRAKRPDVPADLAAVVDKCLVADPAQRFQNAQDVVEALSSWRSSTTTSPMRPKKRGRTALIMAGIVLAVVGAGVLLKLSSGRSTSQPAGPPLPAPMVLVPTASYLIGADTWPASLPNSPRPAHRVKLAGFWIDRTEVTVRAYERFVDSSRTRAPWLTRPSPGDSLLPVTGVAWSDAEKFCESQHLGGRLPTETEWEAAARDTVGRQRPYGDRAEYGVANVASLGMNAPWPVGSNKYSATPSGIVDLIGNVWEWTSSPLVAYPGGRALPDSMKQFRVIRGGASNTPDSIATAWYRGYARVDSKPADLRYTGFRCVRPLS